MKERINQLAAGVTLGIAAFGVAETVDAAPRAETFYVEYETQEAIGGLAVEGCRNVDETDEYGNITSYVICDGGGSGGGGNTGGGGGGGTPNPETPSNPGNPQSPSVSGGSPEAAPVYVPSWNELIAKAYPEACDADHAIMAFMNPAEAQAAGFTQSAENPEQDVEANPSAWNYDYFMQSLENDRNPDGATDLERGSGRLIQLIQECPGLLEPISLSAWTDRGWAEADYESYWENNGQAPTDLEIIVFKTDESGELVYNITPNTAQWNRSKSMILVVQTRMFAANGITAEQFRAGASSTA